MECWRIACQGCCFRTKDSPKLDTRWHEAILEGLSSFKFLLSMTTEIKQAVPKTQEGLICQEKRPWGNMTRWRNSRRLCLPVLRRSSYLML